MSLCSYLFCNRILITEVSHNYFAFKVVGISILRNNIKYLYIYNLVS